MNVFKNPAERRIEALTWGTLLIWVGITLVVDFHRGVPALVAGLILLLSAIVQRLAGWEAGFVLWVGGIALSVSGLNDLSNGHRHLSAFAIVLIIIGGAIILRAITGGGARARRRRQVIEAVRQQRGPGSTGGDGGGPYRDI